MEGKTGSTFCGEFLKQPPSPSNKLRFALNEFKDKTDLKELEQQMQKIKTTTQKSARLIERMSFTQDIKKQVEEIQQLLIEAKEKVIDQQHCIQVAYDQKINQLQKLVQSLRIQWKESKENSENNLQESVSNLQENTKKTYGHLQLLTKQLTNKTKSRLNNFGKQLKNHFKESQSANALLASEIQKLKSSVINILEEQQEKRKELDSVLYTFFQQTCQKAHKSIRRRIF